MTSLWNGSGAIVRTDGTYSGASVWQNRRDGGTPTILAQGHDTHDEGLADSIEKCLNLDGENSPSTNIDMDSNRWLNVSDGAARNQYPSIGQVQDSDVVWVDGGGTVDAITATYSPNVTALVAGLELRVRATGANTSTTPTFKAGTTTAKTIVKDANTALVAGDIAGDGHELTLRYEDGNDVWCLLNPVYPSGAVGIGNVVEDTTPQLGGDLDVNSQGIAFAGATVTDVTGQDTKLVSGTAGTSGNIAEWDENGDLVDSSSAVSDFASVWTYPGAVATTSGKTVSLLSGLPSTITEIELIFTGVSSDLANQAPLVQLGDSGGFESSGYVWTTMSMQTGNAVTGENESTGFLIGADVVQDAATTARGVLTLRRGSDNTYWFATFTGNNTESAAVLAGAGDKSLDTALTQIQLTSTTGSATFDAGSVIPRYR